MKRTNLKKLSETCPKILGAIGLATFALVAVPATSADAGQNYTVHGSKEKGKNGGHTSKSKGKNGGSWHFAAPRAGNGRTVLQQGTVTANPIGSGVNIYGQHDRHKKYLYKAKKTIRYLLWKKKKYGKLTPWEYRKLHFSVKTIKWYKYYRPQVWSQNTN